MEEHYITELTSDGELRHVEDRHTLYILYGEMSEEEMSRKLREIAKSHGWSDDIITRYIINNKTDRGNYGHVWISDSRLRDFLLEERREKQAGEDMQAIEDVLTNPSTEYRILGEGSPRRKEFPFPENMFSSFRVDIIDLDDRCKGEVSFHKLILGKRPFWLPDEEILKIARKFTTKSSYTFTDKKGRIHTWQYPSIVLKRLRGREISILYFHPETYDALFAQPFLMRYPFTNPRNTDEKYFLFCKHNTL